MTTITVNGEDVPVPGTIADLLRLRLDDPRPHGVAVAVDDEVVPRGDWDRYRLAAGSRVEVVTAVQGG